jgi:hypothetical protein
MSYLRNINVIGVALVGVVLFSGVATASASASQPRMTGAPAIFEGTGGAAKLETVEPTHTVSCTANTSRGEINSETTVKGVKFLFTGCTVTGPFGENTPCKSAGASPEEIRTESLKGEFVYAIANSNRAFLDLKPEVGETFDTFSCVGFFGITENLSVTGSVIGELKPVNVSTNKFELSFKKTKGHQEFEKYLEPVGCKEKEATLTTHGSESETFSLRAGLEATETIMTSKNLELSSTKCE